ncbi:uncharacterized protein TRAVEDRAFT_46244 [Trametes versicolor FP-101664 SS1]|uniref:uncharacterized protein n=1 Tax=Trametes versicolor (strain FP-101664) TaxID=717944 RepID=UPI0004623093|nr:uncharacterized protein TRAVEDRAFT_46244 [Trametes versicolor FP-101664 SS1]EIW61019.1 hypothetical protein TRAVEDRAFT_46244 [Trametes versicolor FP-101664 SS1]
MPAHIGSNAPLLPSCFRAQLDTLKALQEEGFDFPYPKDLHALDKAAWPLALMAEVVFDVRQQTITCIFVDGSSVSWSLSTINNRSRCMAALELIIAAARWTYCPGIDPGLKEDQPPFSTAEAAPVFPTDKVSVLSDPTSYRSEHSRQKLLLDATVSDFRSTFPNSLGHNSDPILLSPHWLSSSPLPTPMGIGLVIRPREPIPVYKWYRPAPTLDWILRRYARALLLDTAAGYPPGLYPDWAVRSMLRKTEAALREMPPDANGGGLGDAMACDAVTPSAPVFSPSSQGPVVSDEIIPASSDSARLATETCGYSIHTPVDSTCSALVPPATSSSMQYAPVAELHTPPQTPPSFVPSGHGADMSVYNALTDFRSRLISLRSRLQHEQSMRDDEELASLGIKNGRRRARSCHYSTDGRHLSQVGVSTPACSSPLARCEPVSAEMLASLHSQVAREQED